MNARILEEHAVHAARHVADGRRRRIASQRFEKNGIANLAGLDALLGPDVRRVVAADVPRLQPHFRLGGDVQHFIRLFHRQRERLLAKNVFAGMRARLDRCAMEFRRRHDGYGLNILSLDQRLDAVVRVFDFKFRRYLPGAIQIRIRHCDQLCFRDQPANVLRVPLPHRADSHHPHAQLRHDFLRLELMPA